MHLLALPAYAYHAGASSTVTAPDALADDPEARLSVAERTEQRADPDTVIRYFLSAAPRDTEPQYEELANGVRRLRQRTGDAAEAFGWESGHWERMRGGATRWVPEDPEIPKNVMDAYTSSHAPKQSRCGFSWDDAAAKVNEDCKGDIDCWNPVLFKWRPKYWPPGPANGSDYRCFHDLPDYGRGPEGDCVSKDLSQKSDLQCHVLCASIQTPGIGATPGQWCDRGKCKCTKIGDEWNVSAPIQAHDKLPSRPDLPGRNLSALPLRSDALVEEVLAEWKADPAGLPACRWRPGPGCTNTTQYECVKGVQNSTVAGTCSAQNWFGHPMCKKSCVHVSTLNPVPYYPLWYHGPESGAARNYSRGERHPRYGRPDAGLSPAELNPEARGIKLHKYDVLMSHFCKSKDNQFVVVSLYSSSYTAKAERLIRSCVRVAVCCKAIQLPSDAFGPQAPEGSEAFRFETISMKPSFILSQLQATALPVAFMDVDLEFHQFPDLFVPGSWPEYDRDVAVFNCAHCRLKPPSRGAPLAHVSSLADRCARPARSGRLGQRDPPCHQVHRPHWQRGGILQSDAPGQGRPKSVGPGDGV